MARRVCVTGASGYIAAHLVAQLLARGDHVTGTVRSLRDAAKTAPLRELGAAHGDRLALREADLLRDGSFDAAVAGCETVFHVASPFLAPEQIRDPHAELVRPALEGTRNVLGAVSRAETVRTVVLTSTDGAIYGDYADVDAMEGRVLHERYFNTTSTAEHNPYHYSKVTAEREAWRLAGAQDRWRMVTMHPALVVGPSLTPASESGSRFLIDQLLRGTFFYGAADIAFTLADVRDVAAAHILAADTPDAHGRYLVSLAQMYSFLEIARIVAPVHPRPWRLPHWQLPDAAVRAIGPRFGLTPRFIAGHLGIRFTVDNSRSRDELGLRYRDVEQTLWDHTLDWTRERARRLRR